MNEKLEKAIALEMELFQLFLSVLEEIKLSAQALGTFSPLMADHMWREECYHLMKRVEATNA
ncbi:DUF2935 domain-containing protein [Peribacillus muralis]|uniref:DUF2935 domain-containing protein n=1 Tax=Peribacillus muralis TaxID=264697 RepID=UPI00380D1296